MTDFDDELMRYLNNNDSDNDSSATDSCKLSCNLYKYYNCDCLVQSGHQYCKFHYSISWSWSLLDDIQAESNTNW